MLVKNKFFFTPAFPFQVTAMYLPALVFFSLLVVVSMATHRNFERYNSLQRSRRLGEGCVWSSDCSVQYSHCDAQTRECTCLPYHFQANNSICLPGQCQSSSSTHCFHSLAKGRSRILFHSNT
ncbi:hypothetical protein CEXT_671681 [Caerostris extrusa]|uniref:EB domain-containing protein n=1 Tax=Caerostris extrusa TaxID=172846 RepID=A0AAV4XA35_CAEEX|nr:hypothetical protein CEXT_671681 [Caerostris extrusa]